LTIPLLIFQKREVVDEKGDRTNASETVQFGIWLTTCVCTSIRTLCFFGSLLSCQQIGCLAEDLSAKLSFLLVICHLVGSLTCGNNIQLVLAGWSFSLSLLNFTIARYFRKQPEPLHTQTHTEARAPRQRIWQRKDESLMLHMIKLEVVQCTHELEHSGTSCVVCLDEVKQGDELAQLPCGHIFHANCVGRWLRVHVQCPYRCPARSLQNWMETKNAVADEANQGGQVGISSSMRTQASLV